MSIRAAGQSALVLKNKRLKNRLPPHATAEATVPEQSSFTVVTHDGFKKNHTTFTLRLKVILTEVNQKLKTYSSPFLGILEPFVDAVVRKF